MTGPEGKLGKMWPIFSHHFHLPPPALVLPTSHHPLVLWIQPANYSGTFPVSLALLHLESLGHRSVQPKCLLCLLMEETLTRVREWPWKCIPHLEETDWRSTFVQPIEEWWSTLCSIFLLLWIPSFPVIQKQDTGNKLYKL